MSDMVVDDADDADDPDDPDNADGGELLSPTDVKLIGEFGGTMWWWLFPSNIFLYI